MLQSFLCSIIPLSGVLLWKELVRREGKTIEVRLKRKDIVVFASIEGDPKSGKMGCGPSKTLDDDDSAQSQSQSQSQSHSKPEHHIIASLASQTPFSVNEVESLYELYTKLSTTLVEDGSIHREELQFALFRCHKQENLFLDRMFDLFDVDGNGRIEFSEFVRSLSIFHPKTPDTVKASYAFKLYDLRQTGYIEKEELKEMVVALLNESDLNLSDEVVDSMVEKTFAEADAKSDGKIDEEEWKEYVKQYPTLLKNMTLPYLMDITLAFPSFVLKTGAEEPKM